jgi:hypothetical protein
MAQALVDRAEAHRLWIGDDHGDRIEAAMLSKVIPPEMQIVTKEALDHLRAALDYCAREVWETVSGQPLAAKVYFPIAREGAQETDFASLMNRQMPGVPALSPDALNTFASFQQFRSPDNAWLPELATLVNEAKHENLATSSVPGRKLNITNVAGAAFSSFAHGDAPKRSGSWMALERLSSNEQNSELEGEYQALFVVLPSINVELSLFLREAVSGVGRVIESCAQLLRP